MTMQFLFAILRETRGATAIEYALLASLIALATVTALQSTGSKQKTNFNNVSARL